MFFVNPKHFALLTYSGELDGNGVEDLVEEKKMKQEAQEEKNKKLYNEAKSARNNLMFFFKEKVKLVLI